MQVGADLQPVVVLHQPGSLDWVGGPSQLPRVWVNAEETGPLFGVVSSSGAFAMLATELNCVGMPEGPPSYGPTNMARDCVLRLGLGPMTTVQIL